MRKNVRHKFPKNNQTMQLFKTLITLFLVFSQSVYSVTQDQDVDNDKSSFRRFKRETRRRGMICGQRFRGGSIVNDHLEDSEFSDITGGSPFSNIFS